MAFQSNNKKKQHDSVGGINELDIEHAVSDLSHATLPLYSPDKSTLAKELYQYYQRPILGYLLSTKNGTISERANCVLRRLCRSTRGSEFSMIRQLFNYHNQLGLNPEEVNSKGQSAYSYARKHNPEIYRYMQAMSECIAQAEILCKVPSKSASSSTKATSTLKAVVISQITSPSSGLASDEKKIASDTSLIKKVAELAKQSYSIVLSGGILEEPNHLTAFQRLTHRLNHQAITYAACRIFAQSPIDTISRQHARLAYTAFEVFRRAVTTDNSLGNHQELVERKALYYSTVRLQSLSSRREESKRTLSIKDITLLLTDFFQSLDITEMEVCPVLHIDLEPRQRYQRFTQLILAKQYGHALRQISIDHTEHGIALLKALLASRIALNLDLNTRGEQTGKTALHRAAEHGNTTAFYLLKEAGADLNIKDNENRCAQDYVNTDVVVGLSL